MVSTQNKRTPIYELQYQKLIRFYINSLRTNKDIAISKQSNNADQDMDNDELDDNNKWKTLDIAIFIVKFMIWVCFLIVFIKLEFAAVYLATSAFALIYLNLGNEASKTGRRVGNMSAYSVFNPGCESIDGTLTAQQFEREIRHGSGAVGN